jgi:hypothetical protein
MPAPFKTLLHDLLVDVLSSLLLDLLHQVFNLIDSTALCLTVLAVPLCGSA